MLIFLASLLVPSAVTGSTANLIELPSAANPEILELAQQVRGAPGGTRGKVERIIDLIFTEKGSLEFDYQARPTLAAAEAVKARSGNCLTLVNLVVSIARSAGINAKYVQVEDFEAFYRQQGTVVRTTHVIGGIDVSGKMMYVDFLPRRQKPYRKLRPISDRRAAAHFYNALASEALLADDHELAELQFGRALSVDERSAETWNNYAVLQRRQGDLQAAITSLERAHALDPGLLPPIENLVGMYRRSGRLEKAARFERLAMKEKTKNPYFLLRQGLESLDRKEFAQAEDLLQRARRLEPGEPDIYMGLGRVELSKGNSRAANRLFEKARRMSAPRTAGFQLLLQRKIDLLLAGSHGPSQETDDSSERSALEQR